MNVRYMKYRMCGVHFSSKEVFPMPQEPSVQCCSCIGINNADVTDPVVLATMRRQLLKQVDALPRPHHVAIVCRTVTSFSPEVVALLLEVQNLLVARNVRMGLIEVSYQAKRSLHSIPDGGRVPVRESTEDIAYGMEDYSL